MQLTKTDVSICQDEIVINYSKFQEVRDFYEKYCFQPESLKKDNPDIFKLWEHDKGVDEHEEMDFYNDWLFSYCFKDGLK